MFNVCIIFLWVQIFILHPSLPKPMQNLDRETVVAPRQRSELWILGSSASDSWEVWSGQGFFLFKFTSVMACSCYVVTMRPCMEVVAKHTNLISIEHLHESGRHKRSQSGNVQVQWAEEIIEEASDWNHWPKFMTCLPPATAFVLPIAFYGAVPGQALAFSAAFSAW